MWTKYVTRRLAVQVAQAWNDGWGKAMEEVYGLSVKKTLVFRDEQKTEYYVNDKEHRQYVKGLFKLLENEDFLKHFHSQARKKLEQILSEIKDRLRSDLSSQNNQELLKTYKNFILPSAAQFYVGMWTVFNIATPLEEILFEQLRESGVSESQATEYLLNLSSQLQLNDVMRERIDLLKIARNKDRWNKQKLDESIRKHVEAYRHIPMFDFDHDPYTERHFRRELKQIKNAEKELHELKQTLKTNKNCCDEAIRKLKPKGYLKKLLRFSRENVFLRDYRDMIRQKLNLELRNFYQEAGRRLGLDIEEVAGLTNSEIAEYLEREQSFSKAEAGRRKKAFLLIQKGTDAEIYSGTKAQKKAEQELRMKKQLEVKKIEGIIGSKGRARGRVKVVYTNKDLRKIKPGDVMVATMTRQDFVPAMRKTAAVVIDEGGIISHAAIIARELSIPCITATKNATQVFKDGDMVEVDAEKGVVRKINK